MNFDYTHYEKNLNRQWNTGFFSGVAAGILITCITFGLLFIVYLNL